MYSKTSDLPAAVKNALPKHAQEIFRAAFNSAAEQYKNPKKRQKGSGHEETCFKVAWAAVEKKYHKGDDGKWHEK